MDTTPFSGAGPFRIEMEALKRVERLFQLARIKTLNAVAGLKPGELQDFTVWNLVMNVVEVPATRASLSALRALRLAVSSGLGHCSLAAKLSPVHKRLANLLVELSHRGSTPISAHEIMRWYACLNEHVVKPGKASKGGASAPSRAGSMFAGDSDSEPLEELSDFLASLNESGSQVDPRPSALVRAGIAHFWIKNSGGFGIGRSDLASALSSAILADDGVGSVITGLSSTLRRYPQKYADMLQVSEGHDITPWLLWFAAKGVEAQKRQFAQLEFLIGTDRLVEQAYMDLNGRQHALLADLRDAGPDGFPRGVTASDHMRITGASIATATRDLFALVETGILIKSGKNKWRRYFLNVPRDPIPVLTIEMIL